MKENNFSKDEKQPFLVEWHPIKNGDLQFNSVKNIRKEKVWWLCNKGHEWQATITQRKKGSLCPVCRKFENSFGFKYPEDAKEWHPTKNSQLSPYDVPSAYTEKVWWQCEKEHEWEATVVYRRKGYGCPYCSGSRLTKENSFGSKNPEIAKEWHPDKNGDLTPYDFFPSAREKIWWRCKKGHEWKVDIAFRSNGSGCPKCGRNRAKNGHTLANANPSLAKEWHPTKNNDLIPSLISPNTHMKAWWICKDNHEWEATVASRNQGNHGCPYCSGRYVLRENSFGVKYPYISEEWHPTKNNDLTPFDVASQSHNKVWWLCRYCNGEWQAMLSNRAKGRKCPHCIKGQQTSFPEQVFVYFLSPIIELENRYVYSSSQGDIELDIYFPELKLAIEYDGYYHKSERNMLNDEKKNRILQQEGIQLIRIRLEGLPKLNQYGCISIEHKDNDNDNQYNSLKECLLQITSFIQNDYILTNEQKKMFLALKEINLHQLRNDILATFKTNRKDKSIVYTHPYLVDEWDMKKNEKLKPEMFTRGSKILINWVCSNGHEWQATIDNRANKKSGCPKCSYKKQGIKQIKEHIKKHGSLADNYPDLIKEWHPLKNESSAPSQVTSGSSAKVWWLGQCGHEWEMRIYQRTGKGKQGCPKCGIAKSINNRLNNRLNLQGSLVKKYPELAKEWHPIKNEYLQPSDITPGSHKKVWWKCKKEHEWESVVKSRVAGRGCPYCAGRLASKEYNFGILYPNLLNEWHYSKNKDTSPFNITPSTYQKYWWRCSEGHEWKAAPYTRKKGHGCGICARKKHELVVIKITPTGTPPVG